MNNKDIDTLRTLVGRYYEASLSSDEERKLRSLLDDPSLPAEFHADSDMIRHLDLMLPPEGFEQRLEAKIDSLAAAEEKHSSAAPGRSRRTLWWSAAATVAILVAVGASFILPSRQQPEEMTPEEAYAQVDKALTIFATALNKGYDSIEKAEAKTGKATEKAFNALSLLSTNNDNHKTEKI